MGETNPAGSLFGWLPRSGRAATDLDRKLAATRVRHAVSIGRLDAAEARTRLDHIDRAVDHAALYAAETGRSDVPVPPVLRDVSRIGTAVWLAVSLVNVVVWLLIGLITGQWDGLWVLWPILGGGVLVAGLWWIRELDRRIRLSGRDNP